MKKKPVASEPLTPYPAQVPPAGVPRRAMGRKLAAPGQSSVSAGTWAGTIKGSPFNGERLTNNPTNTANAAIFYIFDRLGLLGLKVWASVFYTGKRLGGNNDTVGQDGGFNRTIALGGFTTLDLSAGYAYQHFSILAKLSNVTNELNYLVHDRYSINPVPPRQFLATVGYHF